jgi:hypothetical protein
MTHPEFIQALRLHAAEAETRYSKATAAYLRGAADRMEAMAEALEEVLRYRRGEGKYYFANLPADERENVMFDAWQEVEAKLSAALLGQDGG